jgi:hypothetical protein
MSRVMIVMEIIWKKVVVTYFEESQYLHEGTERNHDKSESR